MISEFPVFTGKIEHAHTVCTRPSFSQREGPGDEVIALLATCFIQQQLVTKFTLIDDKHSAHSFKMLLTS